MMDWIYCKDELPRENQFVLFCLNTRYKTCITGSLQSGGNTPTGKMMWLRDGTVFWYKLEDVLGWYAFPHPDSLIYPGPEYRDILPITRQKYLEQDEIEQDLRMYYREEILRMMAAEQSAANDAGDRR